MSNSAIPNDGVGYLGSYGRLNVCADLSSEHLLSVPSLHLTEECFDDVEDVSVKNLYHSHEEITSGSNLIQFNFDSNDDDPMVVSEEIQTSPYYYPFPSIDVTLYGVDDSFYENTLRFRKCFLQVSTECCAKICLLSRCQTPVAYKLTSSNVHFTKASPNMGVLRYGVEEILTIFLKSWNHKETKRLQYKIQIGRLDGDMDVVNVWRNPLADISSTPRLGCELIDDNDINLERNEIGYEDTYDDEETKPTPRYSKKITVIKLTPRPKMPSTAIKQKKRRRFKLIRRFFQRIAKAWSRIRSRRSTKKERVHFNADIPIPTDLQSF